MKQKYFIWLFVVALCVFLGYILGFYISQQYFRHLDQQVTLLESAFKSSLKDGAELKMEEVKLLISKNIEEVKSQYDLALKMGLPLTVGGLLASIFAAFNWAAEIAKQKAESAFKDQETILKESAKILVITPDKEDEMFVRSFFQRMGFYNVTYHWSTEVENLKNQHFDLALLNGVDSEQHIIPFLELLPSITMVKLIFYFGKGQFSTSKEPRISDDAKNKFNQLDKDGRLAFANSKSQLYGNLINALKYQKML